MSCICLHARTLNASHTPADATTSLKAGQLHSIKVAARLIQTFCSGDGIGDYRYRHALLTMKALNGSVASLRIARCEACAPPFSACCLHLRCPVAQADRVR